MKRLPVITHSLYAELLDQYRADPPPAGLWPLSGTLVRVPVDGRDHWYFQKSRRTSPGGRQQREYLGPADDPELSRKVQAFQEAKAAYANRVQLVSTLKASGVTAPSGKFANILLGLHEAGVLARAVLAGTAAFQAYGPMLGAKFGQAAFHTMDIDLTEAEKTLALAVSLDALPAPLLDTLQGFDPGFREVPGLHPRTPPVSYVNKDRLRVDVLMPHAGPERGPVPAPALHSHGAPLRFLDFLVTEPVEAVLLVGGGALTHVPSPARFALHKLVVSQRRNAAEAAKARKDLLQAGLLLELLLEDDPGALRAAWEDLRQRGPKGRTLCEAGLRALQDESVRKEAKSLLTP